MSVATFADDYMRLWDLFGTTVRKIEGNITLGSTVFTNTGNAFIEFCDERGLAVGFGH